MFRSLGSSIITLISVILFAFTFAFIWNGSDGIQFSRVAMENDVATSVLLAKRYEEMHKKSQAREVVMEKPTAPVEEEASGEGPSVVLWISIPGFRSDYLEKTETPFFDTMTSEGASTNKMRPSFPCLNFPAHATMATGVPPAKHGIPADKFRLADGSIADHPTDPSLLLAEPIWTTATRQGIKTLVYDWPLSQNQTGENAAAYFLKSFDSKATDEQRLNLVLEKWKESASSGDSGAKPDDPKQGDAKKSAEDAKDAPDGATGKTTEPAAASDKTKNDSQSQSDSKSRRLRLVMIQLTDVLNEGVKHGPRADETYAAVKATDKALGDFIEKVKAEWPNIAPKNANLIVFVTTDHGLAELEKNVNITQLLGESMMAHAEIIAHDAVANLFFKDLPKTEGEIKLFEEKFDTELSKRIYFRTHKRDSLPAEWDYVSKDRVGDRILVLKTGYAFTDVEASEPVFPPTDGPGLFGCYGFPVEESIRMSGETILWGYPNPPATGTLGEIGQLSFHATVCKMLGIKPAPGATTDTLPVN